MMLRKISHALLASAMLACVFAVQACAQERAAVNRQVAVTFDDLPAPHGELEDMRGITSRLLASLKRNGVPVVGFVNERKLYRRGEVDERTELLRAWLEAGEELGNHTFSHINLRRAPLAAYEDDIVRGETVTRMLLEERGMKLRYFRHPFLWTGETQEYKEGLAKFLASRGYTVAPVTIDNDDYVFADAYFKAKKRGDSETAKRVADAYGPYMETVFDFFEKLSAETFGREVRHVLLLHANEINADRFDELAAPLHHRGEVFEAVGVERARRQHQDLRNLSARHLARVVLVKLEHALHVRDVIGAQARGPRLVLAREQFGVRAVEEPVHVVHRDGVNLIPALAEELLDLGLRLGVRPRVHVRVAEVANLLAALGRELREQLVAFDDLLLEVLDRSLVEANVVRGLVAEFVTGG